MGKKKTNESTHIVIAPLEKAAIEISIIGTTPLVTHRYCEKAKKEMLDKQQGKKPPKTPKDPAAEYEEARYKMASGGGDGFKAHALKCAMVSVAKQVGLHMTDMRKLFHVDGNGLSVCGEQCIRIMDASGKKVAKPVMREDYVRVGMGKGGGNDLRYRPVYWPWTATFTIRFDHNLIDVSSIIELVNRAGYANGIGENRMQTGGEGWGSFEVAPSKAARKGRKAA